MLGGIPKPMNYETSKRGNKFVRSESRGATDWDTLKRIREKWKGKLIIKGVMSAEDALKIKSDGADAIQVSNHGGRQLDYGFGGADLIQPISQVVKNKSKIFFDGGVCRGTDVVKAISLGADCVGIGRLQCYAAATNGREGLNKMIDILTNEILVCMLSLIHI